MTARQHILPPATTPLERAWDETLPAWGELADAFKAPSEGEPAAFMPWYAAEYGLAEFAPYFDTVPELLAEGLPWLFVRGSAASLRRALGWLGYHSVVIDEQGAWLHLDLGRALPSHELAAIVHVVRASLPAHVNFYRVFHGYDARPIVLDRGPALDAGMLDGYSGLLGEHGVLESFGIRRGYTLAPAPVGQPRSASTQVRVSVSRYDDMPVLDAWRLDSRVLSALSGGAMELTQYTTTAPPLGGGVRVRSQSSAKATAWTAPAPVALAAQQSAQATPTPVHPPRHWGGPWGGPWRDHFQLISTEET
ncbi:MAG: phage tail protein [Comamonadaceae bacterium]|nr:MAG: phage tail protein [Comamonadaceae bacterium]